MRVSLLECGPADERTKRQQKDMEDTRNGNECVIRGCYYGDKSECDC